PHGGADAAAAPARRGAREDPRDPARPAAVPRGSAARADDGRARRRRGSPPRHRARALVATREPARAARARREPRRLPHRQRRDRRERTRRGPGLGVRAHRRPRPRSRVRTRACVALRRRRQAPRWDRRRRRVRRSLQRVDRPRCRPARARLLGARGQRRVGDRLSDAGAAPPAGAGPQRRARRSRAAGRRGRVRDLSPAREVGNVSERPTAQELTEAIAEFLGGEILPTLDDQRLRFRTLVAMNALSIVYRELDALPPEDDTERRELARRIRAGDVEPGTLARVKADVEARLRVNSPRALERY